MLQYPCVDGAIKHNGSRTDRLCPIVVSSDMEDMVTVS